MKTFKLFNFSFSFSINKKPTLYTTGITNITDDRYFVLFADYDNCNLEVIEDDAKFIQTNFDIGDLIIVCSNELLFNKNYDAYGNFHLIGFTKLTFPELKEILSHLRCDLHFKRGYKYQQRQWVLRLTEKKNIKDNKIKKNIPWLVAHIPVNYCNRVYSNAHLEFFERNYNFKINKINKMFDDYNEVKLINYVTR